MRLLRGALYRHLTVHCNTVVMFGTIIWDVYGRDEATDLQAAIDDLASAADNVGWSSTGIYAFYDPEPRAAKSSSEALLYLGLATDLSTRFAQHNGIAPVRPGSSKQPAIEAWFSEHPMLGYSAFVQSPLHQAHVARFKKEFDAVLVDWTEEFDYDSEARRAIALLEGQLIESAVLERSALPPWNKIGGSKDGKARASGGSGSALIRLMEGASDDLFVSRRSIRELSGDSIAYFDESDILHTARMNALAGAFDAGVSSKDIIWQLDALEKPGLVWSNPDVAERIARIRNSGYLYSTTRRLRQP
jgi:hypothetical protein